MSPPRSAAAPLVWVWAALICYASLYPFSGWRSVSIASPLDWLILPWLPWWTRFDLWSNLIGYLPLGALLYSAFAQRGASARRALLLTIASGATLSFAMEELQNFLPLRVPSSIDWLLNSLGTAAGALTALALHRAGYVERWRAIRERWFVDRSAIALALLLLWPVGLLFPPPVPFGLGQAIVHVPELAAALFSDAAWAGRLVEWGQARVTLPPLAPATEGLAITLGLLAPCLLAFSVARAGWRRLLLVAGALGLGFAVATLSTALNFGPQHALSWRTEPLAPALAVALALAALLAFLPRRAAAGLGLVVLTAWVAVVVQAPTDPYYAESLQAWEQGRFIRFHGVAQWIGWLWPYATMLVLLMRVAGREGD